MQGTPGSESRPTNRVYSRKSVVACRPRISRSPKLNNPEFARRTPPLLENLGHRRRPGTQKSGWDISAKADLVSSNRISAVGKHRVSTDNIDEQLLIAILRVPNSFIWALRSWFIKTVTGKHLLRRSTGRPSTGIIRRRLPSPRRSSVHISSLLLIVDGVDTPLPRKTPVTSHPDRPFSRIVRLQSTPGAGVDGLGAIGRA